MILDVLAETLRNQAENLSFLIKQVNLILQHYEDRQDPQNIGLQFITKVTFKLLHERVKTGENLQPYPGDVNLPIDLYQVKKNTGRVALENADQAIDKAVQASSRAKQNRHKSPKSKVDSSVDVSAKKKESKPKAAKQKKITPMEIPERASSRQTKKTSYVEPDEDEREVEEWHRNAGGPKKKANPTKFKRNNNNDDESDEDDESDIDNNSDDNENEAKENRSVNMDIDDNHNQKKKTSSKQLDLKKFLKEPVKGINLSILNKTIIITNT